MVVQVAEEASPTKWHLAHTTWFFETFVLAPFEPGFTPYDPAFGRLFNSYYQSLGDRHPRPRRGLITRPGIGEVMAYRDVVDERIDRLVRDLPPGHEREFSGLLELGLNHEQQHQELILTDLQLLLHSNPIHPAYLPSRPKPGTSESTPSAWIEFDGGLVDVGHDTLAGGFHYDNEAPRHRVFLQPFALASRLVTNREYLEFVRDGGYANPLLWLDDGWATVSAQGWRAPLYWSHDDEGWHAFTLYGRIPLELDRPVSHLSFYEAEAFARWAGARLPTEGEWEHAARPDWDRAVAAGGFLDSNELVPGSGCGEQGALADLVGSVWQWTRSAHEPYPGYAPPEGAIGEYNGKFMSGTYVLRGGSCATPRDHVRPTYRNFFHPAARWQFAGIRLART